MDAKRIIFESGGCAFDPRGGTLTCYENPIRWRKTDSPVTDTPWANLCRFLLGTPNQQGEEPYWERPKCWKMDLKIPN